MELLYVPMIIMNTFKIRIIPALLLLTFLPGLKGQDDNYILKRVTGKIPLSSINLSPDASLLLAGYQDGSFRFLDPVTLLVEIEHLQDQADITARC